MSHGGRMSKLFDALTRSLLEKYPADWLNQLGLIHGEPVRVMNSDPSAIILSGPGSGTPKLFWREAWACYPWRP